MKLKYFLGLLAFTIIVEINYAQPVNGVLKTENKSLLQSSVFSGKVTGWAINQDFIYYAFYLETAVDKYLVKFEPHIGRQLTSAFAVGSNLSINAIEVPNSVNKTDLQLVNITTKGINIYDNPAVLTVMAPAEEFIYGSSEITEVQKNKQGEIMGYILADKTILRLPLNATEQLNKVAIVGAFVSYSGSQILRHGEFAPENYTVVRCRTITIDQNQYLIN